MLTLTTGAPSLAPPLTVCTLVEVVVVYCTFSPGTGTQVVWTKLASMPGVQALVGTTPTTPLPLTTVLQLVAVHGGVVLGPAGIGVQDATGVGPVATGVQVVVVQVGLLVALPVTGVHEATHVLTGSGVLQVVAVQAGVVPAAAVIGVHEATLVGPLVAVLQVVAM